MVCAFETRPTYSIPASLAAWLSIYSRQFSSKLWPPTKLIEAAWWAGDCATNPVRFSMILIPFRWGEKSLSKTVSAHEASWRRGCPQQKLDPGRPRRSLYFCSGSVGNGEGVLPV